MARSTCPSQNVQNTPALDHFWKLRCRKGARCCGVKHISKSEIQTHQRWITFGSWGVEKAHAVVARSTFPSQNIQSTPTLDHFWKLRCRKSARCCGAKHLSKSKCAKQARFKWTCGNNALCCGAKRISKSKVLKTDGIGALLDVQMSLRVAGPRDCAPHQKWEKREGFVAVSTTTTSTLHYATLQQTFLHFTALQSITLQLQPTTTPSTTTTTTTTTTTATATASATATAHYTNYSHKHISTTTTHQLKNNYTTHHLQLQLHINVNYIHNHNYNYATLHYNTLDYTTLHYPTLHYPRPLTPLQYNCKYTTPTTSLHWQRRLELHYTPLHPAVVSEVTTATIAATPESTTPATFQSISGCALPSVVHSNQPVL